MGPGPLGCSILWLSVIKGIYLEDATLRVVASKNPQGVSSPFCPCHEQTKKIITNKTNFIQVLHYSWKNRRENTYAIVSLTLVHMLNNHIIGLYIRRHLNTDLQLIWAEPILATEELGWKTVWSYQDKLTGFCSQTCWCKFPVLLLMDLIPAFLR